jgi:hypothetical protein
MMISAIFLSAATSYALYARQEMRRASEEEFLMESRGLAMIAYKEVSEWIAGDKNEYDSRHELFYAPDFPLEMFYGDWLVSVKIDPQDDRISINDIFLPDGVTMKNEYTYPWQQIWRTLASDELAVLLQDYLDKDVLSRPGGREEDYFPNRAVSDLSELLRLPEVTWDMLYGRGANDMSVESFFTVYGGDRININLAPKEVLAVLDPDMGPDAAESIAEYRMENDIKSEKDLVKIPGFPPAVTARLNKVIGYKSNYFMVHLNVQLDMRERNFDVMLRRGDGKCQIVYWRE